MDFVAQEIDDGAQDSLEGEGFHHKAPGDDGGELGRGDGLSLPHVIEGEGFDMQGKGEFCGEDAAHVKVDGSASDRFNEEHAVIGLGRLGGGEGGGLFADITEVSALPHFVAQVHVHAIQNNIINDDGAGEQGAPIGTDQDAPAKEDIALFEFGGIFNGEILKFNAETGGQDSDVGDAEVGSKDMGDAVLEARSNHLFDLGGCEERGDGGDEQEKADGDHDGFKQCFHAARSLILWNY